ncbi:MAG: hypothetical protein K2X31_10080, partial [Sphingopyxis sp.]|nr:hypothetical protein [Sphingopyxis sp.]
MKTLMNTARAGSAITELNSMLGSLVLQLAACLIVGMILPVALWFWPNSDESMLYSPTGSWSMIAAFWAGVAAVLSIPRMSAFPGASVVRSILPAFASAFGIAMLALLILRLPYSSVILGLAFAGSVAVRFLIEVAAQRAPMLTYHIVLGGNVDRVLPVMVGRVIEIQAP